MSRTTKQGTPNGEGAGGGSDLESRVREVVMGFVHRGLGFTPIDVAGVIAREVGAAAPEVVARLVRRIDDAGLLRPFGYRRTLAEERTRHGIVTALYYAPPASRRTRARLERRLASLAGPSAAGGLEVLRAGEILTSIRALAGARVFERYVERELGMSPDTARRLIRVATVFRVHPARLALSGARPSLLYKLAERSFPRDLREALLAEGALWVDGERRRLEVLTVGDLRIARAQFEQRQRSMAGAQAALAIAERAGDNEAIAKRRAELRAIASSPMLAIRTPHGDRGADTEVDRMTRKPKARSGLIVAIDGPAGAGKSTVSKRLAERLGLVRVDTGAIYRTVALVAKDRRLEDEDAIARACEQIDLRFEGTRVFLGEREVTAAIRTPEISTHASVVSAMPAVRRALLDLQRRFALAQPTGAVLEGRDIGTVVFPDADMKIFLNASIEERARRRTEELEQSGRAEPFERVLAEMKLRDERDQQRAVAPLKAAADAIPIDTTGRSVEEIVEEMAKLVEAARKG